MENKRVKIEMSKVKEEVRKFLEEMDPLSFDTTKFDEWDGKQKIKFNLKMPGDTKSECSLLMKNINQEKDYCIVVLEWKDKIDTYYFVTLSKIYNVICDYMTNASYRAECKQTYKEENKRRLNKMDIADILKSKNQEALSELKGSNQPGIRDLAIMFAKININDIFDLKKKFDHIIPGDPSKNSLTEQITIAGYSGKSRITISAADKNKKGEIWFSVKITNKRKNIFVGKFTRIDIIYAFYLCNELTDTMCLFDQGYSMLFRIFANVLKSSKTTKEDIEKIHELIKDIYSMIPSKQIELGNFNLLFTLDPVDDIYNCKVFIKDYDEIPIFDANIGYGDIIDAGLFASVKDYTRD